MERKILSAGRIDVGKILSYSLALGLQLQVLLSTGKRK